ncbi:MAG: hypothetical protein GF399_09585 [Candidatus Coatesbacteria bacterium]|nr:hypothetical protein [Candidatus Coatesbacteria bacterium]
MTEKTRLQLRHVGLVVNPTKPRSDELAERIRRWADNRGLLITERMPEQNANPADMVQRQFPGAGVYDERLADSDLLLSLGGDGTLLTTAHAVGFAPIPILGINLGNMGFLAEVSSEELERTLDALVDCEVPIDRRLVLEAEIELADGRRAVLRGLNDVVLHRTPLNPMSRVDIYIAGDYLGTALGDGVIVATPTGSTGYSLSCGGPVLTPWFDGCVLTTISPHSLNLRPLVYPADNVLEIRPADREEMMVVVDGQLGLRVCCHDKLRVYRSERDVRLIGVDGQSFFQVLRDKLHWGHNH